MQQAMTKYSEFFAPSIFQYLRDFFVISFVVRGIVQSLYKCKRINIEGAQQLCLDFATLKTSLLGLAGKYSPSVFSCLTQVLGPNPPTRYVRLINHEVGRVEAILKLIMTPNEVIIDAYLSFCLTSFLFHSIKNFATIFLYL